MDELDLLARALPDAPPPSPEVVARARARLAAGRTRSRTRVWVWALGAAMATAAVVTAITVLAGVVSAPAPVLVQPRNAELLQLADRVERLPDQRGAYWREVMITGDRVSAGGYKLRTRQRIERRVPLNTAERSTIVSYAPTALPASSADERAWRAAGAPARVRPRCAKGNPADECRPVRITDRLYDCGWSERGDAQVGDSSVASFTLADLAAIPADRNGLLAKLREYHRVWGSRGFDEPFEEFLPIAGNLLHMPIRPQLRAAILRLLAELPGTKVHGMATDPLGRQALSVTFTRDMGSPAYTNDLLDPRTGAELARVGYAPGSSGGDLLIYTVWAPETGWTTQRPPLPKSCKASR
ncbi:CU044_5270 family protein [Nonomuraea sp. JJY05]|uniref:CU044_5270 family protein n=1 Tax=Nonomuraea sp. JJY05 TaxID=3350255 RepID=UPI00373F797B